MSSKAKNLAGITFGRLKALERSGNIRHHAAWVCECVCGKRIICSSDNLSNGHTRSCGCLKKDAYWNRTSFIIKTGPKNSAWKGDDVGYTGLHLWIYRQLGKAKTCIRCGKSGTGKQIQWANISGEYKRDVSDFEPLCASCHKKQDYFRKFGNACRKGHEFTEWNTKIDISKDGTRRRICKTCRRIAHVRRKSVVRKISTPGPKPKILLSHEQGYCINNY